MCMRVSVCVYACVCVCICVCVCVIECECVHATYSSTNLNLLHHGALLSFYCTIAACMCIPCQDLTLQGHVSVSFYWICIEYMYTEC